ncbi:hypothetical protein C5167_022588 [Papaver somniferum]|uniref:Mucin-like protein n=1 Tax=Papaver somniferum TaxID=3469 RepID=A0A4Y7JIB3_PAPSO|nr:uncharacterized protein LOC113277450 [Papaver somniferum]RZC60844.1 hypothetical protein C5167_022588 [Papaver somniferum]
MRSLKLLSSKFAPKFNDLSSVILKTLTGIKTQTQNQQLRFRSTKKNGDEEWNDAWETAWLPEEKEVSEAKTRAPWETTDVHSQSSEETSDVILPLNNDSVDPETKAFVEDMTDNWNERRNRNPKLSKQKKQQQERTDSSNLYSVENIKRDYRLKKQRIHSGLWMKEIEKLEEAKLSGGAGSGDNDIDKLLDSCSEIFDSTNNELDDTEIPSTSEFKTKPDGWETTSKTQDGNVWEISQREEDILLQEYERRIAYCKFQIASFIKSHIFSRRRPIDGWRYMIEVIGPNARKGKGSAPRLPSLSDASTQPYKEEKTSLVSSISPYKRM